MFHTVAITELRGMRRVSGGRTELDFPVFSQKAGPI